MYVTVLIHRSPQVLTPTRNRDEYLVDEEGIAESRVSALESFKKWWLRLNR
jgi:hypothetical protein